MSSPEAAQRSARLRHRPPALRRDSSSSGIASENGSPLLVVNGDEEATTTDCAACICGSQETEMTASDRAETNMASASASNGASAMSPTSKSVSFERTDASSSLAFPAGIRPAGPPNFSSAGRPMMSRQADPYAASLASPPLHGSSTLAAASVHSSSRSANVPLPSPSAVHINQSLEESLRRAEEERQRRSQERRLLRRRRKLQQQRNPPESQQQRSQGGIFIPDSDASAPLQDVRSEEQETSIRPTSSRSPLPHVEEDAQEEEQTVAERSRNSSYAADEDIDEDDEEDSYSDDDYTDSEDENGRSLTRQLAETAVSVREMSRELGRARVKSNIQSVLIVTKARDNQLIKLTREIAIYLMKTPRNGKSRGMTVYVDSQLRKSKRFDAAGLERDNPELFRSASSSTHHHHHHHGLHSGHHTREGSSTGTSRRNSSRRQSNSASSINLLGMTAGSVSSFTSSNGYSSSSNFSQGSASATASGATTPALMSSANGGKPLTKLTEALVSRQLDRQLERESQRRESLSGTNGSNRGHASGAATPTTAKSMYSRTGAQTPLSPSAASSSGKERDASDEQQGQLRYWTAEMCSKSPHLFDLVVTLGGDGTVLFTSWLFQHVVPPVIPFALGSLGFLTNFDFANYKRVMDGAVNDGVRVNLRMRFTATIYRAVDAEDQDASGTRRRAVRSGETGQIFMEKLKHGGWDAIEAPAPGEGQGRCNKDREVMCSVTRPVESFEVLNDLVVDRGPSPYVSLLELFGDEHHMTTVQADGLCVATPTGSTAYSLSAGGSLVHPEIPTLLITPICPHTLSFRPMLLPDSMELRICVPYNSRSTAWASFDGRGRVELRQGDHIKVTASQYPFPTVCADKQSTDWFQAITRTLKWNERQRQKSFVVVEHDRQQPHDSNASKAAAERGLSTATSHAARSPSAQQGSARSPSATLAAPEGSAVIDEEEDDGTFDIDDIPTPAPASAATQPAGTQAVADGVAEAQNQRQSGAPVVHPPASAASVNTSLTPDQRFGQRPEGDQGDYTGLRHTHHLREYSTNNNASGEGRQRTPRASSWTASTSGGNSAENGQTLRTPRPTDRQSRKDKSPRHPGRARSSSRQRGPDSGADKVKAFVVYGADSSDADTSASED